MQLRVRLSDLVQRFFSRSAFTARRVGGGCSTRSVNSNRNAVSRIDHTIQTGRTIKRNGDTKEGLGITEGNAVTGIYKMCVCVRACVCVCVCVRASVCVGVEHSEIKLPKLHLTNRISKLLLQQKPNGRHETYQHYPTTMEGAVLKSLLLKRVKTSTMTLIKTR